MEYESSDDDEPIKQQRVVTEAMQRPHYQTPQFVKQIDKMTRDKLGEKQRMVRPDFVVPYTNLNTNMRNDPLLYVAPIIYVWDPPSQYGVQVKCQGGDHKMHSNQWRDCLFRCLFSSTSSFNNVCWFALGGRSCRAAQCAKQFGVAFRQLLPREGQNTKIVCQSMKNRSSEARQSPRCLPVGISKAKNDSLLSLYAHIVIACIIC